MLDQGPQKNDHNKLSPLKNFKRSSSQAYEEELAPWSFLLTFTSDDPRLEFLTSLFSFIGFSRLSLIGHLQASFFSPESCFKKLSQACFRKSKKCLETHCFRLRIFLGAKVQTSQNDHFLLSVPIVLLGCDPNILRISSREALQPLCMFLFLCFIIKQIIEIYRRAHFQCKFESVLHKEKNSPVSMIDFEKIIENSSFSIAEQWNELYLSSQVEQIKVYF